MRVMSAFAHPFLADVSAFVPISPGRGKPSIVSYAVEIDEAGVCLR